MRVFLVKKSFHWEDFFGIVNVYFMDQIPRFSEGNRKSKIREIDTVVREIHSWWGRTYVSMKRTRVKTWKGALLLAFIAGTVVSLIWIVSLDIETESSASINRPVDLLEIMKRRGCIADGLLSGYGGDTRASIELINRSECLYLHRALESWLNPPDFELARRTKQLITKPDMVYGMFISEALNTEAEYYSSLENRVLKFSDMCQPKSEGFWGDNTCKASFASKEYRAYVRDITQKAMDIGIRSFLLGKSHFRMLTEVARRAFLRRCGAMLMRIGCGLRLVRRQTPSRVRRILIFLTILKVVLV